LPLQTPLCFIIKAPVFGGPLLFTAILLSLLLISLAL